LNWKKGLRTINKWGAKAKDVEAVVAAVSGDTGKAVRRVKNKTKNKILNKTGFWKR